MKISEPDFINIMEEVLDNLPEKYANRINNLALLVTDFPSDEQLQNTGRRPDNKYGLLGLYEGYIQSSRRNFGVVTPDRITLFRVPIMQSCDTLAECRERIQETLLHEIAHTISVRTRRGREKPVKLEKKRLEKTLDLFYFLCYGTKRTPKGVFCNQRALVAPVQLAKARGRAGN